MLACPLPLLKTCIPSFRKATLETTQGQIHGFLSPLPFKCYIHLWEIDLRFAPGLPPGRRGSGAQRQGSALEGVVEGVGGGGAPFPEEEAHAQGALLAGEQGHAPQGGRVFRGRQQTVRRVYGMMFRVEGQG